MSLKFNPIWICAALVPVFTACGSDSADRMEDNYEAVPVVVERDDNWSLVDKDGKFLYEDEFENQPSAVVEGHFIVREGDYYVLYKAADKKPVAVSGCDELVSAGIMSDGLIPVTKKDSRITVVNKKGEQVFELTPYNNHEIVECDARFFDDLLCVRDDENNYGFVNRKGEMVIKPQYQQAGRFSEGLAVVRKDDESPYMVIDKKGETVFKLKKGWTPSSFWFDGVLVVSDDNDRVLFVDRKGESVKCPSKVKSVRDVGKKYFVFTEDGNDGVMDRENMEVVIRPKYAYICLMPDNKFLCVESSGEGVILNSEGDKLIEIDDYQYGLGYSRFFGLIGREKNDFVVLDDKGKPVKGMEYYNIGDGIILHDVRSDYFDIQRIADLIAKAAAPGGVDNYKFGKTAASVLPGTAADYKYTRSADIESLTGKGYKFTYATKAEFLHYIADYHYSYGSGSSYTFTPDNELVAIEFTASISKEIGENAFNRFVEAIKGDGYTLGASNFDEGLAVFRKGNTAAALLRVKSSYGDTDVTVRTAGTFTEEEYNTILRQIDSKAAVAEEDESYYDEFQPDDWRPDSLSMVDSTMTRI